MRSILTRCLLVVACLLSLLAGTRSAGAAPSTTPPTWWPLASASVMDCYKANPGDCHGTHPDYLFDIKAQKWVNDQPVYSMGAGTVHVGATATGCGHAQSRGNYVYVDHGHGVRVYYGHLGKIFVHNGQHVTARTTLAYVGNSGYAKCRTVPWLRYLMLAKKVGMHLSHGAWVGGHYAEITSTTACPAGHTTAATWPQQLPSGRATHWNAVHRDVPIPATTRSCIPA